MLSTIIAATLALAAQDMTAKSDFVFVYMNGSKFLANCGKDDNWCRGYVSGVNDGLMNADVERHPYCPRETVTANQMKDVALRYVHDHPEERDLGAAFLIKKALVAAYPCKSA